MADLKFTKSTDEENEIKLDSNLIYAEWRSGVAIAGQKAKLEVGTSLVGNGATIKIKGKSEKGKKLGKIKDVIKNNKYVGELEIPEDTEIGDLVYFEVKLPKNGLDGESNRIAVVPPVKVTNMKWSASEARRGDILKLSADVKNVPDETEVKLIIYEYDQDSAHDKITELPATVKNGKVEVGWEYEYHEDTDEIPTEEELKKYGKNYNPPEYFFTILIGDTEFGKKQESGLLEFKDWLEIELKDASGAPVPDERYVVYLPDGKERSGKLDSDGRAKLEDIPPGTATVEFPDME